MSNIIVLNSTRSPTFRRTKRDPWAEPKLLVRSLEAQHQDAVLNVSNAAEGILFALDHIDRLSDLISDDEQREQIEALRRHLAVELFRIRTIAARIDYAVAR